jgi:hypothetical protein
MSATSRRGSAPASKPVSSKALRTSSDLERHDEAPDAGLLRFLKARPSEYRHVVWSLPIAPIQPEKIAMPDTVAVEHRQRKRRRRRWFHSNRGSASHGAPK